MSAILQHGIGGDNINIQVIKKYDELMTKCNWVDFESFKNCAFGYWKITFKSDQPNWKLATCTCPIFYKRYICKHIVGIAMLKKLSGKECPLAAKTIPLGARRRPPGRPQHAPLAYARMTNFTSLAQIDDEAESEEVIEDSGAQEPEPLDSVQSSMQEENVPSSSSISENV